jgi:hypothetical protein
LESSAIVHRNHARFSPLDQAVNTIFKVTDVVIDQNEYYSLNTIIWISIGIGAGMDARPFSLLHLPGFDLPQVVMEI